MERQDFQPRGDCAIIFESHRSNALGYVALVFVASAR